MFSRKSEKIPPFHVMEVLERATELERSGKSIIHLEIGEPDFPPAPHICEAAFNALKAGETKYTHSLGLPELREAVAQYYNQKFSLEISSPQVIITSGTSPALQSHRSCNASRNHEGNSRIYQAAPEATAEFLYLRQQFCPACRDSGSSGAAGACKGNGRHVRQEEAVHPEASCRNRIRDKKRTRGSLLRS